MYLPPNFTNRVTALADVMLNNETTLSLMKINHYLHHNLSKCGLPLTYEGVKSIAKFSKMWLDILFFAWLNTKLYPNSVMETISADQ